MEHAMKRLIPLLIATSILTGCMVVPAYGPPAYGEVDIYATPPAVVVEPSFYGRFNYYDGHHHRRHHRRH
jgi:hypothetical protein